MDLKYKFLIASFLIIIVGFSISYTSDEVKIKGGDVATASVSTIRSIISIVTMLITGSILMCSLAELSKCERRNRYGIPIPKESLLAFDSSDMPYEKPPKTLTGKITRGISTPISIILGFLGYSNRGNPNVNFFYRKSNSIFSIYTSNVFITSWTWMRETLYKMIVFLYNIYPIEKKIKEHEDYQEFMKVKNRIIEDDVNGNFKTNNEETKMNEKNLKELQETGKNFKKFLKDARDINKHIEKIDSIKKQINDITNDEKDKKDSERKEKLKRQVDKEKNKIITKVDSLKKDIEKINNNKNKNNNSDDKKNVQIENLTNLYKKINVQIDNLMNLYEKNFKVDDDDDNGDKYIKDIIKKYNDEIKENEKEQEKNKEKQMELKQNRQNNVKDSWESDNKGKYVKEVSSIMETCIDNLRGGLIIWFSGYAILILSIIAAIAGYIGMIIGSVDGPIKLIPYLPFILMFTFGMLGILVSMIQFWHNIYLFLSTIFKKKELSIAQTFYFLCDKYFIIILLSMWIPSIGKWLFSDKVNFSMMFIDMGITYILLYIGFYILKRIMKK